MCLYDVPVIFVLMEADNYLFVYGTLLDRSNEFGNFLRDNCSFNGSGKFKGWLYDIGEYPGALADDDSPYHVHGQVFSLENAAQVLALLDDYEGFGPEQEQPNLFVRELLNIETDKGLITCWCYLYNLSVEGLGLIERGNYLEDRQNY